MEGSEGLQTTLHNIDYQKNLESAEKSPRYQVRQDNSHLVPVSIKYLDSGGSSSLDLFYVAVALHFIGSHFETYVESEVSVCSIFYDQNIMVFI